jgi:hypothetical protein
MSMLHTWINGNYVSGHGNYVSGHDKNINVGIV